MTATAVDGITVIEDTPSLSPLSRPGKPVYFQQIRHLLMSNGSELYGCTHCTYTSPKIGAVRPHLKAHKNSADNGASPAKPSQAPAKTTTAKGSKTTVTAPKRPAAAPPRRETTGTDLTTASLAQLNLGELVTQAQSADALRKQRDLARKERDAARSELDSLRTEADKQRARADEAEAKLAKVRRTLQL